MDTTAWLHGKKVRYWEQQHENFQQNQKHYLQTRFARAEGSGARKRADGDKLLARVEDIFHNGFGVNWSEVQCRIFKYLIDSCLPRIYGAEWEHVKTRVMHERKIEKLGQETLVNMARRNGKTYVVSGTAAALLLVVPGITIAVFSVGKRQAGMFMSACIDRITAAFERGTHVNKEDFNCLQKSQEMRIYEMPDGSKQVLGCYPGSVKVSKLVFLYVWFGFALEPMVRFPILFLAFCATVYLQTTSATYLICRESTYTAVGSVKVVCKCTAAFQQTLFQRLLETCGFSLCCIGFYGWFEFFSFSNRCQQIGNSF